MEPHSTQKKGRDCKDCHQDPKVLGLGYGKLYLREGKLYFEPLEVPIKDTRVRLSQIIDFEGNTLVKFNRPGMRGFKKEELLPILRVGLCLNCHPPKDKIFANWKRDLSCPRLVNLSLPINLAKP